jgi:signal transduction histidine kinase
MPDRSGAGGFDLLTAALFLIAYVVLEWVGFIHEYEGIPTTPWNPGLGVVFALMVFAGPYYAAVLFVGVLIAEFAVLRSSLEWWVVVGIAAIFAVSYGLAAAAARRWLRLDPALDRLRDVVTLLATGFVAGIFVALILSILLLSAAVLNRSDIFLAVIPMIVGDFIGIAVMAPVVLRLALGESRIHTRALLPAWPQLVLWIMAMILLAWMIVKPGALSGFNHFYLLFVPVVVIAVRQGLDGACVALAATQFSLVLWLHLYGYDATAFTEAQMLMLVLTTTGLVVGVIVSERQRAQKTVQAVEGRLRLMEAEAARASRVALVSGMASALAHEINQPMTAARALARAVHQILQMPTPDLARAGQNLTTLIAQIDHAAGVVRRTRDFLRRGRPHVSTIEVQAMIDDTLALLANEAAARKVQIDAQIEPNLPLIHGDRIQLQQVFLNLVRNAIEAIGTARTDGRVVVSARYADKPPRVEFGILDNGTGIEPELVARLFEPLMTSKHEGLGLGLSISASIVEAHGGRIWHVAETVGGTEFRLSLPVDTAAP